MASMPGMAFLWFDFISGGWAELLEYLFLDLFANISQQCFQRFLEPTTFPGQPWAWYFQAYCGCRTRNSIY